MTTNLLRLDHSLHLHRGVAQRVRFRARAGFPGRSTTRPIGMPPILCAQRCPSKLAAIPGRSIAQTGTLGALHREATANKPASLETKNRQAKRGYHRRTNLRRIPGTVVIRRPEKNDVTNVATDQIMTAGDREVVVRVGNAVFGRFATKLGAKKGADESAQASREISRAGARLVRPFVYVVRLDRSRGSLRYSSIISMDNTGAVHAHTINRIHRKH